MIFLAGIELNHVARSVESDLLINTVSVYLSVRLSVSNLSVEDDNSTSTYAIFRTRKKISL